MNPSRSPTKRIVNGKCAYQDSRDDFRAIQQSLEKDAVLISSKFTRDLKPDDHAFERGLLISILTRSLVEQFFAKYLKAGLAPDLDVILLVDKK